MQESAVRFYFAETIAALEALHAMGFVHRDIKPDNIMIAASGHIKLGDFGSSARLDSAGKAYGRAVGTPHYLAPEILVRHHQPSLLHTTSPSSTSLTPP